MAFQLVDFNQLIGQITTTQIAPGSITTPLLAANIVKAGIVDGTTITGAQIVADGTSGDFLVYSGTPAANNIIASVSPAQGTDAQGNTFYQGIASYQLIGANLFYAQFLSGGITWGTTGLQPLAAASITATALNGPGNGITLYSGIGTPGGASTRAVFVVLGDDAIGNLGHVTITNSVAGGVGANQGILTVHGNVAADFFVTALSPLLLESWHTIGAASQPTFNPGFASAGAGTAAPVGFQLEGINGGRVRLRGQVNLTANQVQFATIFTLPAGYVPASTSYYTTPNNLSSGALGVTVVKVTSGGAVQIGTAGTNGNFLILDNIVIELD